MNKIKKYRVYTTCRQGWVYEVKATTKQKAREEKENGNYKDEKLDMNWQGDSQEEVYFVEEIKTKQK